MRKFRICRRLAVGAAIAASLAAWAGVHAQASANTSPPLIVKEKPAKPVWMKAEVVHADKHSIVVRERDNAMMIHTFTYSERAQGKMDQVLENGGYESGDNVKIRWIPGSSEAMD